MCFLRGPLRWLTEQKNPKFLWSLQNAQRDTTNLAITGQSLHKSWYIGGDPGQGSWCCFSDRLNQSLVLSVVQANSNIITRQLLWIHERAHDIGRHSSAQLFQYEKNTSQQLLWGGADVIYEEISNFLTLLEAGEWGNVDDTTFITIFLVSFNYLHLYSLWSAVCSLQNVIHCSELRKPFNVAQTPSSPIECECCWKITVLFCILK